MKKIEVPDWLLEMSNQMSQQDNRVTAHPFWQVRCKERLPTAEGYSDEYQIFGEDGVIYFSLDPFGELIGHLLDCHEDWCKSWTEDRADEDEEGPWRDYFESYFEVDTHDVDLPDGLGFVYVQEVDKVISTHFTQADAEWFIQRKQHDYPPLFTYVESAYWSPQIRQLQDWIIGFTKDQGGAA